MSIPKSVIVDDVKYIREDCVPEVEGDFVIVRCKNAGVHAGTLVSRNANTLELANSRRLWRWWSSFTLSGLAIEGPLESKMDKQKYACIIPMIQLTSSDVAEVIHCTALAKTRIMSIPDAKNE